MKKWRRRGGGGGSFTQILWRKENGNSSSPVSTCPVAIEFKRAYFKAAEEEKVLVE